MARNGWQRNDGEVVVSWSWLEGRRFFGYLADGTAERACYLLRWEMKKAWHKVGALAGSWDTGLLGRSYRLC